MIFVTAALDQIETNNASNLRASVRIGRDIDSSEARAPQFGPRADAGLERAVGEAPTTDLYFFATFSQCVYDAIAVASAADRRFPENRLTSDHLISHCRRVTWQATSGEPDDARDAAECARSLFSTSETASTASAGRPVRAMSKSSLRSSSSDDLRRHGKASHLGIGDDRPHAWQGCMSISGRRWRARMQIGQTGLMVYRF